MRPHGVDVSAIEQIFVGRRVVLFDPVDEFELPHQSRLAGLQYARLVLRHEARAPRDRNPRPGLVLHPRQINRRARHRRNLDRPRRFWTAELTKISWPRPQATSQAAGTTARLISPQCT